MPPFDLLPHLIGGVLVTLQITIGAAILAAGAALAAGLGRLSPSRTLRWSATVYVEVFRGTSALVQLFWFYFGLPLFGVSLDAMTVAIVVLGLNTGAYGAEVVRGAVHSIPVGQTEAALALGLSRRQTRWKIVLPQALLAMLPPAGNLLVELLKSTALVSLITLSDLTFRAQTLRAESLRTIEILSVVLVLYFLLAQLLTGGMRRLEHTLAHGRDHGGLR